jgi:hypothetical protein
MWKIGVQIGAACLVLLTTTALAPKADARPGIRIGLPLIGGLRIGVPRLVRPRIGRRQALRSRYASRRSARAARASAAAPAAAAAATAAAAEPRMGSARTFPDLMHELNEFCTDQAADLQQWPSNNVVATLELNDDQRRMLDQVRSTASLASDALSGVCRPNTAESSIVRLGILLQEIEFVTQALDALRPPLKDFYNALDAQQKERLNAGTALATTRRERAKAQPGLALACASYSRVLLNWPDRKLDRALKLQPPQRAALDNLRRASAKGAGLLVKSCPDETPTTPPERLDVMRQRLDVIGKAVGLITQAFGQFYESLSDEQKALFERLSASADRTAAFNQ